LLSCRNAHPFTRNALNAPHPRHSRAERRIKIPSPTAIGALRSPPRSRFAQSAFAKVAGARRGPRRAPPQPLRRSTRHAVRRACRAARPRAPVRFTASCRVRAATSQEGPAN